MRNCTVTHALFAREMKSLVLRRCETPPSPPALIPLFTVFVTDRGISHALKIDSRSWQSRSARGSTEIHDRAIQGTLHRFSRLVALRR